WYTESPGRSVLKEKDGSPVSRWETPMRLLKFVGLITLLAAVVLLPPQPVRGQGNAEEVQFSTIDEVQLWGMYYPSARGKKAPIVLLLHKVGRSSSLDNWPALAQDLQKAGYAVLRFDFRGHGNSNTVQPGFWQDKANQKLVKGFDPDKPKETI